jgi:hypothetical protein
MAGLVLKYNGRKVLLEGQRIKVGRAQGKNGMAVALSLSTLTANSRRMFCTAEFVIADQQVSSEHLVITNGVLIDARSTNGTYINGNLVRCSCALQVAGLFH